MKYKVQEKEFKVGYEEDREDDEEDSEEEQVPASEKKTFKFQRGAMLSRLNSMSYIIKVNRVLVNSPTFLRGVRILMWLPALVIRVLTRTFPSQEEAPEQILVRNQENLTHDDLGRPVISFGTDSGCRMCVPSRRVRRTRRYGDPAAVFLPRRGEKTGCVGFGTLPRGGWGRGWGEGGVRWWGGGLFRKWNKSLEQEAESQ